MILVPRAGTGRPPVIRLYDDEACLDGFAGGGGTSEGITMVMGRPPDVAINHDAEALAMHEVNHPETRHIRSNIRTVRYEDLFPGRRCGFAWFSPDCTFHSKARGGKPFRDRNRARRIRGLAWELVRCAVAIRPRVLFMENVEEFKDWSPIGPDGLPDATKKGASFRRWVSRLRNLGGVVDWRELRASHFGAPTSRKRLFIIIRFDGQPIVWPTPTHGPGRLPYRTAAECIDFSLPVPSIFLTPKEAKSWGQAHGVASPKRPLATATKRRIARGVWRYVLNTPTPFIVGLAHGEHARGAGSRSHGLSEPLRTIHASGGNFALVAPILVGVGGRKGQSPETPIDRPFHTITAKADTALVQPMLAPFITEHANASEQRNMPADEPLRTICAQVKGGHFALVTPFLASVRHHDDSHVHSVDEPIRTIPASDREFALIAPLLINTRNGERDGQAPRVHDIQQPFRTITAAGSQGALVAAFLAKHNGGHEATGQQLERPIDAVTARDSKALVTSHLVKLRGGHHDHVHTAQDVREPAPTLTAGGTHVAEVRTTLVPRESIDAEYLDRAVETCAFLVKFFGTGVARPVDQPAGTLTTKDRIGLVTVILVTVGDVERVLVDIGMRMLTPRELFLCQGFPPGYQIEHVNMPTPLGIPVRTKLTKKAQTRLVGNSVPPDLAAAILRANLSESLEAIA